MTIFLAVGCEPREPAPPSAPIPASGQEAALRAQVEALREQVGALDAEADSATRELVKVKVERDVLKRELNELRKRRDCAP